MAFVESNARAAMPNPLKTRRAAGAACQSVSRSRQGANGRADSAGALRYRAIMIDREPFVRRELFGGQGAVKVWDLLQQTRIEPFAAALACELDPGGSVGAHVQQQFPEIVVCVEGRGSASVDGVPHALEPGALVALPHGKTLAIRNDSSEAPLRYLIIKARAL
jgi:quercetin dioxygenase-like cupin family protein